ncbi:MAG: FkbM family methyltransferase [Candidatus Krumholzibacteria bacterium]|nr:FkbM family methyltransferase [Candidatus Krumholzibacteria bacterium]
MQHSQIAQRERIPPNEVLLELICERAQRGRLPFMAIHNLIHETALATGEQVDEVVSAWNWLERSGLVSARSRAGQQFIRITPAGWLCAFMMQRCSSQLIRRLMAPAARALLAPRAAAKSLRSRALRKRADTMADGEIEATADGLKFCVYAGSTQHRWYALNPLDADLRTHFLRTCISEGDVVYDVGAHIGLWTIPISLRVGPYGRVVSVEPDSQSRELLLRNIERNGCTNVNIVATAISNIDESREFWSRGQKSTHSFFEQSYTTKQSCAVREWMKCQTIDALVASGQPRPDCIKLDIEGAEMLALQGASRTLPIVRALFIEVHQFTLQRAGYANPWDDIERLLRAAGFDRFVALDSAHLVATRVTHATC